MSTVQRAFTPACRLLFLFAVLAGGVGFAAAASAQVVTPVASNQVTMSLDQDLITFVKWAMVVGGAILVFFGWFFGVDVAKTRAAMLDAREDIAKRLEAIRMDHQTLKELKDRLQKLGAELEGEIEKAKAATNGVAAPSPQQRKEPSDLEHRGPLSVVWDLEEKKRKRIREVLATSQFEWSTLGTLEKKTGLPQEEIEALAQNDPLVQVGHGQQGATLLRLIEFNFPAGIGSALDATKINFLGSGSKATKAFRAALWEHAQKGKGPIGNVPGGE